jgi:hypothetical protein
MPGTKTKKTGDEILPKNKRFSVGTFFKRTNDFRKNKQSVHELVTHLPNPKFCLPSSIHIASDFLHKQLEEHFTHHEVFVPIVDENLTWPLLVQYNPLIAGLSAEVIGFEGRDYPDKAWDVIANKLAEMVYATHQTPKKEIISVV